MNLEDNKNQSLLIPDRHPQQELFICDVADAVLKDIIPQMEHPFYSLSKKPDTTIKRYEHNGNWIEITPSVKGLATIYDKDILIYAISQLISKIQRSEKIKKRVKINSYELLRFTNRGTAGKDYQALCEAFDRLGGTRIKTNIVTGDKQQTDFFGLVDSASIDRKNGLDGRLLSVEITLSDWVFNAIKHNEFLTLHRDYFRLRKPLERRIYEIARKHCGQQASWKISLSLLLKKSGSKAPIRKFRYLIKNLTENDHLPDYTLAYDRETDHVTFINRNTMPIDKPESDAALWDGHISAKAFETVGSLGLRTDKYALEQEFREWITAKGIHPKNPDAMFITFCKKRL